MKKLRWKDSTNDNSKNSNRNQGYEKKRFDKRKNVSEKAPANKVRKTGEIIRKPVPAVTLHQIAKDMIDRKNILDKAFEEKVVSEPAGNKLADLAERFAKLAEMSIQNKKPTVEVTDVVFATEEKHLAENA
jgi:hypothetical protein